MKTRTPLPLRRVALVALAASLTACGDIGAPVVGWDASFDHPPDIGPDLAPDVAPDLAPDVPVDRPECVTDADCVGNPNGPSCNRATGRCGPAACPAPRQMCGDMCLDVQTNVEHCGACNRRCPAGPNSTPTCMGGLCGSPRCNEGFGDCDGVATNGCEVNLRTSTMHCGMCGNACTSGPNAGVTCTDGMCVRTGCTPGSGFTDCDMNPANGCEVNTQTDTAHCGMCGNRCPSGPNSAATCAMGRCGLTCSPGFADCNMMAADGCEADLASTATCGMCGNRCPSGPNSTATCAMGRCGLTCATGFADCNMNPMDGCEVDLRTTPTHCGMCGNRCPSGPNSTATCTLGACGLMCAAGFADCNMNPMDGCEVDLRSTIAHCGRCGNVCPMPANASATCAMGACGYACNMGFGDCNRAAVDGCEVDLRSTVAHCGMCGNACNLPNATAVCRMSACAIGMCNANFADCNMRAADGCEANLQSDNAHCGACGRACAAGSQCTFGFCHRFPSTGADGAFNPTADTVLRPGVHNFTTINIPRGVTVRSDGNGPLDLRATGPVTVAGVIDVSGGDGGRVAACNNIGGSGGSTGGGVAGAGNISCPSGMLSCGGAGGPGGAGLPGSVGASGVGGGAGNRGGGGGGGYATSGPSAGSGGGGGGGGFAGGGGGAGAGRGCMAAPGTGAPGGSGGGAGGAAGGSLGGTAGTGGTAGSGAINTAYAGTPGVAGLLCSMGGSYGGGGGGGSIGPEAAADLTVDRNTFQPGSSGGGGGGPSGGGGGGGGGAVRLASPVSITIPAGGQVLARGGSGGTGGCGGGGGGGGSGGVIYLYAPAVTAQSGATIGSDAGGGGFAFGGGGQGGPGGLGRIRVSVLAARCALAPVLNPTLFDSTCAISPPAGIPRAAYIRAYPE